MTEQPAVAASTRDAIRFMTRWHPRDTWVFTAIHPDLGYVQTAGFEPNDWRSAARWLAKRQGRRNLYFQVNTDSRLDIDISTKSRKEHIATAVALHADVDPDKSDDPEAAKAVVLDLLRAPPDGVPVPSVVIDSGGGFNVLWRLTEPVPLEDDLRALKAVERRNVGLMNAFGADSTFDVNRILRLPGTVNLPNKAKRDRGRVPVASRLVWFNDITYPLSAFPEADPKRGRAGIIVRERRMGAYAPRAIEPDEFEALSPRLRRLLEQGKLPDEPRLDDSRSSWLFGALVSLIRANVPDEVILALVLDERLGIATSVLEKTDPETYARRQIARAHGLILADYAADFTEFDDPESDEAEGAALAKWV